MKKFAAMITAFIICVSFLMGCGKEPVPSKDADKGHVEETASPENAGHGTADSSVQDDAAPDGSGNAEAPAENFPTAADYYRFLRDAEIEEFSGSGELSSFHLASVEAKEIDIYRGDFMEKLSWHNELYGVISAVVEDFDNDGKLEMLMIAIGDASVMDSRFGSILYDEGAAYDPDNRNFELRLRYYDSKDGEIYRDKNYSIPFATLPMDGWGHMVVGMEKLDDQYELYTWVYSENMSTYGPKYFEVVDVPGDLEKYITGISEYGLSEAEANKLILRDKVWDIASTTLYDTYRTIYELDGQQSNLDPDEDAYRDVLGEGLLCFVNVAYPEWGGDKAVYTLTDYTNLRHYLNNDAEDWTAIEIPQGGERKAPETPNGFEEFISGIETAVGVTFADKGTEEEDGILTSRLSTEYNTLSVKWDTAQNIPVSVGWFADGSDTSQEWFDVKDAILSSLVFGWAEGEADMLKGEVKWDKYSAGVAVGDYTCMIANVVGASLNITRN